VRGQVLAAPWAPAVVVTYHPSAVLRAADDDERERMFRLLIADLRLASAQSAGAAAAVP
jgi:hypothetical protein